MRRIGRVSDVLIKIPRCILRFRRIFIEIQVLVDASTVQRVVQCFKDTGAVEKAEYPKGHNDDLWQRLTKVDEHLIINLVLNRPSIYLHQVQQELAMSNYMYIFAGFTRKKLSRVALQRSEAGRVHYMRIFLCTILTCLSL